MKLLGQYICLNYQKLLDFYCYNKIKFILPSNGTGNYGSEDEVGMVLRTAPHNVPAPPSVHVPVDIDGMCSSMHIEIYDGVSAAT